MRNKLGYLLHLRQLEDEEGQKVPAQRRPQKMLRDIAKERANAGTLDEDGNYHKRE